MIDLLHFTVIVGFIALIGWLIGAFTGIPPEDDA